VTIKCSEDSIAGIEIKRTARGYNFREANRFADEINYAWNQQDTVLSLDPIYRLNQRNQFHAQQVDVIIDLPTGTVVYLDKSLRDMLYSIQNSEDTWSGDLVGDEWIMTPEGLTRVQKNLK